ncbi:Flp pilus assembly protein CpaB [Promicromonospora panici]|uniref:Flp pilus assembly protein CpaB n=1 Tax=Promicromonospora panici TaxID=2219658 RepID=UPI00101C5EBA|nr:SAF domain-containing protein [Promicromonospora panici]
MRRRIVAAVAAILLAIVGVVLLTGYVAGADQRAMAGMKTTSVLVVTQSVAAGTKAEDLAELVAPKVLPARAVAPGALTSLDDVAGQEVTADLVAGEQVLAERFAPPKKEKDGAVDIPKGMHEISIMLESQRVVGSSLVAGQTVGVFTTSHESRRTHQVLHEALVTRVEGGFPPPDAEPAGGAEPAGNAEPAGGAEQEAPAVPEGSVVVTLALSAPDAETLVWSQEIGSIWLSREPVGAPRDGTRTVTEEELLG